MRRRTALFLFVGWLVGLCAVRIPAQSPIVGSSPSGAPLYAASPAARNYYIATNGSDLNPCSISSKCLTLAHVQTLIPMALDRNYIINVADGTYTEGICMAGYTSVGNFSITVLGDLTTMDNVVFSGTCTYPGFRNNGSATTSVYIYGPVFVYLQGLETTGAGVTYGMLELNGANVQWQHVDIESTGNQIGAEVDEQSTLGLLDFSTINVTTLGATLYGTIGLDVQHGSEIWFSGITGTPSVIIEAPSGGTAAASPFLGIHAVYGSRIIAELGGPQANPIQLQILNSYYGIQLGLQSSFSDAEATATANNKVLIYNSGVSTNKTDGSRGIQVTDNSSFSVNSAASLQIQGFQYGTDANSLAYAEFAGSGTLSRFFITTAVLTSTGGVTLGL